MASNKSVTVLAPNGRRQNVKVTPNTTILQILEEVCKKQGFKSEEYDLRHHNHVLDTTALMRYSGLPNNAQLEMSTVLKTRAESSIVLGLHLESGDRVMGNFMPTASLWDVIKTLCPDEADPNSNPVIIYMRREVSGVMHLSSTTLRCLGLTGGRALLRYVHSTPEQLHRQANVSAPLQQRPVLPEVAQKSRVDPALPSTSAAVQPLPEVAQKSRIDPALPSTSAAAQPLLELPVADSGCPTTSTSETMSDAAMEVDEPAPDAESNPSDSYIFLSSENMSPVSASSSVQSVQSDADVDLDGEIVLLGERNAIVFSMAMAQSVPYEDLPEDFYDLTLEDARALYRDIKRARAELDDAPLATSALRELDESKRVLTQLGTYKRAVLRIQFPDRSVLQGTFLPLETISIVEQFVAQYLSDPTTLFHLFTTPPKTVLSPDSRLVEVGCVPSAMLYFGASADCAGGGTFLRADLLTRLTSPTAAALAANRSRGLIPEPRPSSAPSTSHSEPVASASTAKSPRVASSSSQRSDDEPSSKVPKWFKPPMK